VRHAGHRDGPIEMSPNARVRVYLPHNFREPLPAYDDDEEESEGPTEGPTSRPRTCIFGSPMLCCPKACRC
jgi:hypothetical protein